MPGSQGLWLIAESKDTGEGEDTKGAVGKVFTVPENGYSAVKLNKSAGHTPETMLPGTCSWNMGRVMKTSGIGRARKTGSTLQYGPVTAVIDPEYVPIGNLIDLFLGSEDINGRVSWKFFGIRDVAAGGKGGESGKKHWFTLTGTNGWIHALSYGFGAQDHFTAVMSATTWEWSQWNGTEEIGPVRSAHFDEKGNFSGSIWKG